MKWLRLTLTAVLTKFDIYRSVMLMCKEKYLCVKIFRITLSKYEHHVTRQAYVNESDLAIAFCRGNMILIKRNIEFQHCGVHL